VARLEADAAGEAFADGLVCALAEAAAPGAVEAAADADGATEGDALGTIWSITAGSVTFCTLDWIVPVSVGWMGR